MPFPTTGVLDDFNRANEGPPPSENWDYPVLNVGGIHLSVVSNAITTSTYGSAYWKQVFPAKQEVFVTISTMIADGDDFWLLLRGRQLGTGGVGVNTGDGYFCQIVRAASVYSLKYHRIDNAVLTQIGSTQTPGSWTAGDKYGVRIVGSELQSYQCAVSSGIWASYGTSLTETTYTHDGQIGCGIGISGVCVLDNFGGGAVTGRAFQAGVNGGTGVIRPRPFAPGLAR